MGRFLAKSMFALLFAIAPAAAESEVERGAYLTAAGGCESCHTDIKGGGAPFAGGRALKTPFGTFYSPNITPDAETGIGGWDEATFVAALRQGRRPGGDHYFPAFPYTTYARMSDADARAIRAYLATRPAVRAANRAHDVPPPFGWRWPLRFWRLLFFDDSPFQPDPVRTPAQNRGAYLVEALTHCGECHTPRNLMGALDREMWMAGTADGPEGELAPNITPHATGIADWSEGDLVALMRSGLKPNYDDVQGTMADAVKYSLSKLTDEDLKAIAAYLAILQPIENRVRATSD